MAKRKEEIQEPLEKQLWKAADKLRKNIDAAEYKHVVLGLIFLKYISVSFEELYQRLMSEVVEGADPEDREEYKAENVFFVPADARWSHIVSKAKDPQIGKFIDEAMDAIEKENASLKGVLPKVFARQNLDPASLGELIGPHWQQHHVVSQYKKCRSVGACVRVLLRGVCTGRREKRGTVLHSQKRCRAACHHVGTLQRARV